MTTKSQTAANNETRKGPSPKKERKLAQRKHPVETAASESAPHERRDAPGLLTAEVAVSSPQQRHARDAAHAVRVRGSSTTGSPPPASR